jgi:hypothetical protein
MSVPPKQSNTPSGPASASDARVGSIIAIA